MKEAVAGALVALVALSAGCEIVAGIKRRPLAGGGNGGGGAAGMTTGVAGTTNGGGTGGIGTGGSVGGAGGKPTRIGTSCPTLGDIDCDGQMSRTTLACGAGYLWTTSTTCSTGQLCDTSAGVTHGTCLPVIPECAHQAPGDHVCIGTEVRVCGPDLVSSQLVDGCLTAVGECARCKPVVLATGQGRPSGIALDGGRIYWQRGKVDASGIVGLATAPVDGIGGATFLGGALGGTSSQIAIKGAVVYGVNWRLDAQGKEIASPVAVPIEGGQPVNLDTSGSFHAVSIGLAIDDNNVYWGDTDDLGGAVLSLPLTGGSSTPLATNQGTVIAITCDASNVYWTTDGGNICKTPIGGGPFEMLASAQQSPRGISVRDGFVYWNDGGATLSAVSVTGGTVMTLATGATSNGGTASGMGIAVDATTVYWSDTTNNKIMRVRKGGGTPVTIAAASTPMGLVVDDTNIYWANSGDSTIMKIAK